MKSLALLLPFLLAACASQKPRTSVEHFSSDTCRQILDAREEDDAAASLDQVSNLYRARCWAETISEGERLREEHRDKFYSVSTEMAEIFIPEGTLVPYVFEAHERSFLSLLMAMSYLHLEKSDDAAVELRRAGDESAAILYNSSQDQTTTLLLAAMWDRFDPSQSRPYWKRLGEMSDGAARDFANRRLDEIDARGERVKWHIEGLGRLPELDWERQFFSSKAFEITTRTAFPDAQATLDSLILPAQSWTRRIAARYDHASHPVMYLKNLARLPFGLAYGFIGVSVGATAAVGGCVLAAEARDTGPLCRTSIEAGGWLIGKSADLSSYTLKPDLRHWRELPAAFSISRKAKGDALAASYGEDAREVFLK